jgi:Leucine-rich repeat (LRR) protein
MKKLHLPVFLTLIILFWVNQLSAITQEWNFSSYSFRSLGLIESQTHINGLSIYANSDKPVTVDESLVSVNDVFYTHRIKLGGAGSIVANEPEYRILSFYAPGNTSITVICTSSSDTEDRELLVVNGNNGDTIYTFQAPGGVVSTETFDYTGNGTNVYLMSKSSGINLYSVKADSEVDQGITLFDPASYDPANLPSGMSIVEIDNKKYLKAPLNDWSSIINIDPFFISSDISYLVFQYKYKEGNSGYTVDQVNSFFKFFDLNWSEIVAQDVPSDSNFVERFIPVYTEEHGAFCGSFLLAGLKTADRTAVTGDTIFIGQVHTYINEPDVIFDPANYNASLLPEGMDVVNVDGEKLLQVVTNGWSSNLNIQTFNIKQGYSATCSFKYALGNTTADSLTLSQINSRVVLMDVVNEVPNPWGEGMVPSRVNLIQSPANSEMTKTAGRFSPEMQYIHLLQFAGQKNYEGWQESYGDTLWVGKIEQVYIPHSQIEVKKTTVAPTLDGVEEECWNGVEPVRIMQDFINEHPSVTAYWKAMWADSGMFVLVNVQDNDHWPSWEAGSDEFWLYDGTEVAFDVNPVLNDGLGASNGEGHYQHSGLFVEDQYGTELGSDQYRYASQLSGENYTTEYFFPYNEFWDKESVNLTMSDFLALDSIGFDVYVADRDEGHATQRQRKVWHNTGVVDENYMNMDNAGSIKLIDENVPITDSVMVTFRVDMRDEQIHQPGVTLQGSFDGWQDSYQMTNTYDDVYEVSLLIQKNTYHEFKYLNGYMSETPDGDCTAGGEYNNRFINVPSSNEILDLVCFNRCSVCPPSHVDVSKTETAPILDGVIDAVWDNFDPVPVSKNYIYETPTVDAYWKAMWADSGIYVLIEVEDDDHYPFWEVGSGNPWEYDGAEVAFDVNSNLYDGIGSCEGQGHSQYIPEFTEGQYGVLIDRGSFQYANQLYGENWVSELYFPFTNFVNKEDLTLFKNDFLLLDAIGFDVYIIDQDETALPGRHRKVWQNNGLIDENCMNMDDAGTISLVGEEPDISVSEADSMALVALYNSTNGDSWNNNQGWLTDIVINWQGVTVQDGRVTVLDLQNNNLTGQLPSKLANLTALITLNIGNNWNLDQGGIPDLSMLTSLRELFIASCNRNGNMPGWLLQSTGIEKIDVSGNALTGTFPTNFVNSANITHLDLAWNQFDIPEAFPDYSQFVNIVRLRLAGSNISGPVPEWVADFSELRSLLLGYNNLSGALPAGLSSLSNLEYIYIQNNAFNFADIAASGILPVDLSYFGYSAQKNVQIEKTETETQVTLDASAVGGDAHTWYKDDVEIDGETSSTLIVDKTDVGLYYCVITNSQYPDLTLTSDVLDVGVFANGVYVDEYDALVALYNALGGTSWDDNTNWLTDEPVSNWYGVEVWDHHVIELDLSLNNLSGDVPAAIGDLSNLEDLNMARNNITSIPSEIGNLNSLYGLNFSDCYITELPNTIGDLVNLWYLDFFNNQLSALPDEITNLSNLTNFWVSYNQIESLPDLSSLPLENAGVDNNKLTFSDLINCGINPSGDYYYYSDQDKIEVDYSDIGSGYTLDVSFAGGESHQWYKNGVLMPGETSAIITISGYEQDYYHCVINHSSYPYLTLESEPQGVEGYLTHGVVTSEYNALIDFYNQTGGENWRNNWNWLGDAEINQWFGVDVEGVHITELHLTSNNISGTLPASFDSLTELKRANFYDNQLSGLPDLSTLSNLNYFNVVKNTLDFNDLSDANLDVSQLFFNYQTQKDILVNKSTSDNQATFTVPDVGAETYQWYYNSNEMQGENGQTLTINDTETGYYYCTITNSSFPDLTIQTVAEEVGQSDLTCGILTSEYNALVALYNATKGDERWLNKTNWLSNNPASDWYGVDVRGVNVSGVDLGYNGLRDTIPREMMNLTRVRELRFRGNRITGLHPNVGNLSFIETLDLSGNELAEFPVAVTGLTSLRWLFLDFNNMTGSIPGSIGNLINLWDLYVGFNQLSGQLPAEMSELTQLIEFDITSNNLTGMIPEEMGNNLNLRIMNISNNNFHHTHIEPIMQWNNYASLDLFDYSPQNSVGTWRELYVDQGNEVQLFVDGYTESENDLYQWYKNDSIMIAGANSAVYTIPEAELTDAGTFHCVINNSVTSELTLYSGYINLHVGSVGLVGSINNWGNGETDIPFVQDTIHTEMWGMEYTFDTNSEVKFRLNNDWVINWGGSGFPSGNMIENGINNIVVPAGNYQIELNMTDKVYSFNNIDSLALVALYNATGGDNWNNKQNWLTGALHTWYGISIENGRVEGIEFSGENNLNGHLPAEIGDLTALRWFVVNGNDGLTGPIPATIGNLDNLESLNLSGNSLTGSIPSAFSNAAYIRELDLNNNQLSGSLPDLSVLTQLNTFRGQDNKFTFANLSASGIEPGNINDFAYAPQDTILAIQQDVSLLTALDCGDENNQINWYCNGILVAQSSQTCNAAESGYYNYIVTNSVYADLVLYSDTIEFESGDVPVDRQVSNYSLSDGNSDCLDAQNDIAVAGDGTQVIIQSGASTNFIAGHSILFRPGFHAQTGSYVDAHITTTGSFCDDLPAAPIMAAEPIADKSVEFEEPELEDDTFERQSLVVYPNPNNGSFTIKLENIESETRVLMYSAIGQKVYDVTMTEQLHSVELPNVQRGIYFIKAINNQKQFDQKIVVQ